MKSFKPYKKTTVSEKIVTTIRIDNETLAEIDKIANKIDVSRNELINQCIKYALDNLKNTEITDKKKND